MPKKPQQTKAMERQMPEETSQLQKKSGTLFSESIKKLKIRGADKKAPGRRYVQDFIGIDKILGNVVFLSDGSIVGIMEIVPVNFYQRSVHEQNSITQDFQRLFKICPHKIHFKVSTEEANISTVVYNIRGCNVNDMDPKLQAQVDDYIDHIQTLQGNQTLCQKFYVIYEYDGGVNGKKSDDTMEIVQSMYATAESLKGIFYSMGNLVVETTNDSLHTAEILYRFFNPRSCTMAPLATRQSRLMRDMEEYNKSVPKKYQREIDDCDVIAPKGIDMRHHDFIIVDGQYETFLALRDNGYPPKVYGGWLDMLGKGRGIDIDVICTKAEHDRTISMLEQYNRINRIRAQNKITNPDKYEEMTNSIDNISYITNMMKNHDEDMFEVMVIITIRADSFKDMCYKRDSIVKNLQSRSIYTIDSFLSAGKFYRMVMPFCNIDSMLFNRAKHTFITSSMASLYCFTAYELFDETGYVLGTNASNNTLVAINNFNTARYANANMLFLGTSGSGKTFATEMLAYRMRMTGVRTIFILPTKGRTDYYGGCKNIGGTFISFTPAGENHINILGLRPVDRNAEDPMEDETSEAMAASLLATKIASVTAFIQLLMGDEKMSLMEESILGKCLTDMYAKFGITIDNDSVWVDGHPGKLKEMPILSDLLYEIGDDPDMKRITMLLKQITSGSFPALNSQTNVDLTNKYIVFDIDGSAIAERMHPAFLYVAFDLAYSMAKEHCDQKDAIILDEVWRMMGNEKSAKQVQEMVKLIRAYGSCVVLTTQDIEDFLGRNSEFGAAVVNNTEIKVFMKLTEKEIQAVDELMNFTPEDKKQLKNLNHQGMIFSNGDKVVCNMIASEREAEAFTTDINARRRIAEKKKRMRAGKTE